MFALPNDGDAWAIGYGHVTPRAKPASKTMICYELGNIGEQRRGCHAFKYFISNTRPQKARRLMI